MKTSKERLNNTLNLPINKKYNYQRLMAIDFALGGHHGNYIEHLAEYWHTEKLQGELFIVVLADFFTAHTSTSDKIQNFSNPNIHLITITTQEQSRLKNPGFPSIGGRQDFQQWSIACHYAQKLQATHCLFMYFDTCEFAPALGLKTPCPFSGIYFRPTFHYGNFSNHPVSWREKTQTWREKSVLSGVFSNNRLDRLFCLDPYAVKHLQAVDRQSKIIHLADPVFFDSVDQQSTNKIKNSLGFESDRKIGLLFGALNRRKGIDRLLDAIATLPAEICRQIGILLVGGTNLEEQARIASRVAEIQQLKPIKISEKYEFVDEQTVAEYFQLSDFVLAPYQKHVGMSGILLLAAAARKPVLSSDYGLMGQLVKEYQLGLAVDSTREKAIADGLKKIIEQPPEKIIDLNLMEQLVTKNSVKNYCETIFKELKIANSS